MAEIKQGLNYEITANDKSSAVVNKAAETAKKAAKDTEESSKKAGEAFKGEFNPMSAVLAGISGNTQALAQQMLGLVSRMKSVHMTMMRFSVYAAIISSPLPLSSSNSPLPSWVLKNSMALFASSCPKVNVPACAQTGSCLYEIVAI